MNLYRTLKIFLLTSLAKEYTLDSETFICIAISIFDLSFARRLKYSVSAGVKLHNLLSTSNSGSVNRHIFSCFILSFLVPSTVESKFFGGDFKYNAIGCNVLALLELQDCFSCHIAKDAVYLSTRIAFICK